MSSNGHVRMGTAYNRSAYGSSQGLRVQQLGGLREDDASLRLGGLREDDASLRLSGLREDDASLRLGNFADQDNAGAFQAKISGLGVRSKTMVVDKRVFSNSNGGSNGTGAASGYNTRRQFTGGSTPRPKASFGKPLSASTLFASGAMAMSGLREDDASLRLGGLREDDASLRLGTSYNPNAYQSAQSIRVQQLGGLREDDASLRLGRTDFHPRFPVKIEMKGLGSATHNLTSRQISGLFDFLKAAPTDTENRARVQALINTWRPLKDIISRLPGDKQSATVQAISKLDTSVNDIDFVTGTYMSTAVFTREQTNRMTRIEAAMPSIQKLVADMQAFAGPYGSSGAAADHSIITSINDRANSITTGMTTQNVVVAVAGGAVGLGIIYAVVKALQKHN